MNVTVVSHFRNAVGYLERYFEQIADLENRLVQQGHSLTLVLGYGDSNDGTGEALYDECAHRFHAHLVDVSHGGPYLGSVVHPQRFKQLAYVGNKLWKRIPEDSDIVGLVESDLIWQSKALDNLIYTLQQFEDACLIAPMVMHRDGRFYDTWAFRKNGINFRNDEPFHPEIRNPAKQPSRYYEMDSVGSVFFTKCEIAKDITWPEEDAVVGFCRQVKERGAKIILDGWTEVYHP